MDLMVEYTIPSALFGILDVMGVRFFVQQLIYKLENVGQLPPNLLEFLVELLPVEFPGQTDLETCLIELHINLFHRQPMPPLVPCQHHIKQFRYILTFQHKFPSKSLVVHFLFGENKMCISLLYVFSN